MNKCRDVREALALDPAHDDDTLREHLEQCETCAGYHRQHQSLDLVLRAELRWEAPAALTARLMAVALPVPLDIPFAPQPMVRERPKGWYVTLVYALTTVVIVLSLAVAWQFFGSLVAQVGLADALTQLLAAPARGLTQLTQTLPESRYLIAFFLKVRDQLMWLLLVAVLWAALDKWNPQFSFGRFQRN
jgi:hypothetical protein